MPAPETEKAALKMDRAMVDWTAAATARREKPEATVTHRKLAAMAATPGMEVMAVRRRMAATQPCRPRPPLPTALVPAPAAAPPPRKTPSARGVNATTLNC